MLVETGIRVTENAVISHAASGAVLNVYRRHKPPLDLWMGHEYQSAVTAKRGGHAEKIKAQWEAGRRYGALWRGHCRPRSPAHSDTTRIIVDGASAPSEHLLEEFRSNSEFAEAQKAIGNEEAITFLNRLCGLEDWPWNDKRRFKRVCRKGLERLVELWRRR